MPEQGLDELQNFSSQEEHVAEDSAAIENPFFRIITSGDFNHDGYHVKQNNQRTYPPDLQNDINTIWEKRNKEREEKGFKPLTDTPQLRLEAARVKDGKILVEVTLSSYKDHIAWQDKEFRDKHPDFEPNVTGTNIVVRTSDVKLMIVQRSLESATKPGAMSVAGGQWDITKDCDENGIWDPFKTISRELEEETGVKREDLKELKMKGIVFNKSANNPSVVFFADTDLSSDEIKQRSTDREVDVKFINDDQEEIEHSILWWASSPSPSGSSSLSIYGSEKLGLSWLQKINNRLIRRDERLYSKLSPEQLQSIDRKASDNLTKK